MKFTLSFKKTNSRRKRRQKAMIGLAQFDNASGQLKQDLDKHTKNAHDIPKENLDEEVLRETLEEQARAEKEWEDRIKKEEAERELFILEFGVQTDSEYETD
ncbi:hypothetical protein Tco_0088619 [Tanacetum coccineum]